MDMRQKGRRESSLYLLKLKIIYPIRIELRKNILKIRTRWQYWQRNVCDKIVYSQTSENMECHE